MSKITFKTSLGRLRIAGFFEGISLLILLFVAMPLKYFAGIPEVVQVVGLAHGILFIMYMIYLIQVKIEHRWDIQKTGLSALLSFVPFGTFYADKKWFR